MKPLCAIKACRNPAPGVLRVIGARGRKRKIRRNVCAACIEKIRRKFGVYETPIL